MSYNAFIYKISQTSGTQFGVHDLFDRWDRRSHDRVSYTTIEEPVRRFTGNPLIIAGLAASILALKRYSLPPLKP